MVDLDQWLRERTFHHSQFSDIPELVRKKRAADIRISLCIPTLNEAQTVGKVIRTLKRALMDRHKLIDEIAVVDSGSSDGTREIARKQGAEVFLAADSLPSVTAHRGKGENLWKSLYLLTGDIIVWVDADIRNIHPRFVYGLLGPLLQDPEIGYVKSFYRRPLRLGRKTLPGGGRVTELMVRPFLNLLFPDLAVVAQPLSGEYAGRRSILERLPFFTGYGVETGLLIDIEHRYGIGSIAQVDMDVRIHRNQSIESLRRMSSVILSVLMRRSEQLGKLALFEGVGRELHYIRREGEGYQYDAEEVQGKERPPILTIAEYRQRYGIDEDEAALAAGEIAGATGKGCLGPLLDERRIILDLEARDRDGTIRELVNLAARGTNITNPEEPADAIIARENRVSTNVGHGVALPHVVTDAVDEIVVALGRSVGGIEFPSALVRRKVHIVVLILAPSNRRASYLNTLSCLAGLFRHRRLIHDLMNTRDRAEAISLLRKYESLINLQKQLHPRRWG